MSSNMFACLGDSDDEAPKVVAKKETKPAAAKDSKPAAPAAPVPKDTKAPKDAKAAPAAASAAAGGKKKEGDAKPRAPKADSAERPKSASKESAPAEGDVTKDASKAGKKTFRHGEKIFSKDGAEIVDGKTKKRQFDRRSGSDKDLGQKKDGGGAHGFGNVRNEALTAEKDPSAAEPEVEDAEAGAAVEAEAVPEVVEPAGPPLLTLDEFLVKRNEARANNEVFAEVKTREVDVSEFSGLKKSEGEDITFIGAVPTVTAKVAKKGAQRSTGKTALVANFSIQSVEQEEFRSGGGGGRGRGGDRPERSERSGDRESGRGGDRAGGRGGRGGRGGARPASSSSGARVDISDSLSFPSL